MVASDIHGSISVAEHRKCESDPTIVGPLLHISGGYKKSPIV